MKKVLVTGGGLLWKRTSPDLLKNNYKVRVLDTLFW